MTETHGPTHYLKPTGSTILPSSLVFYDTEAWRIPDDRAGRELHHLRLGVAVAVRRERGKWTRRKVIRFTEAKTFWDWLNDQQQERVPVWAFAHNAGYDLTLLDLWERIDLGHYDLGGDAPDKTGPARRQGKSQRPWRGCMIVADPPTIIALRSKYGTVRFIDTFNYFQESVEDLGASVGLEKVALPAESDSEEMWFARCERDVEIIERVICGHMDRWETLNAGVWQETAAGLAWAAFRRQMPAKSIVIDHKPEHTSLARAAYYTGRAEVYWLGIVAGDDQGRRLGDLAGDDPPEPVGPVYLLDVRSCYPFVMRANYFPVEWHKRQEDVSPAEVLARMRHWLPIARVLINSTVNTYPVRLAPKDPAVYARGAFYTSLAGPELETAIRAGDVAAVPLVHWYIPGEPFTAFVDRWYAERCERDRQGDQAGESLCKLILDALSGKWGQHKIRWEDRPWLSASQRWGEWHAKSHSTGKNAKFRGIAGLVQEYTAEGEGKEAFAPIAAYITSYAREWMRALKAICPAWSVLYEDTDALLVTQAGRDALAAAGQIVAGQLGALQQKNTADAAELRAVKFYRLGDEWTVAGVKDTRRPAPGPKFKQERWQGLGSLLGSDPAGVVHVDAIEIDLSRAGLGRPGVQPGWQTPVSILHPVALPF